MITLIIKGVLDQESLHRLEGIRAGKEDAFRKLFQEYYRPLTVFALKYLGDLEDSKEIVQDFFVALYERRESLHIESSLRSYLYQSVRNRCLNHLSAQKRKQEKNTILHISEEETNSLEEEILKNETEHIIFKLVSKLPPQCRQVFRMSREQGLSNEEISRELNISKRTVETHISKALKVLREKISRR